MALQLLPKPPLLFLHFDPTADILMSSMTYDKESIRRLLRVAFEDARGLDIATPSHEDCIYFRSRLIAIRHEKLRFFLAHVLEDLLTLTLGIEFDSQDAEQ